MTKVTLSLKDTISSILAAVIPALTSDDEYKFNISRVEDRNAVFIEILVPSTKVGLCLGKKDVSGTNPTKMALVRIIRQAMFHFGYKELYIEITDLEARKAGQDGQCN